MWDCANLYDYICWQVCDMWWMLVVPSRRSWERAVLWLSMLYAGSARPLHSKGQAAPAVLALVTAIGELLASSQTEWALSVPHFLRLCCAEVADCVLYGCYLHCKPCCLFEDLRRCMCYRSSQCLHLAWHCMSLLLEAFVRFQLCLCHLHGHYNSTPPYQGPKEGWSGGGKEEGRVERGLMGLSCVPL